MASDSSHNHSPLTEAQWAGLARLGDLGNRLGALLDGPLAGPATAGLDRLGELGSRYDFETLSVAVLGLVEALHRAGLLRLGRDHAVLIDHGRGAHAARDHGLDGIGCGGGKRDGGGIGGAIIALAVALQVIGLIYAS